MNYSYTSARKNADAKGLRFQRYAFFLKSGKIFVILADVYAKYRLIYDERRKEIHVK